MAPPDDPFVYAPENHGYRTSGGQLVVPNVINPLNATVPRAFQQLLEWESFKGSVPCELQLQSQYQPAPSGQTVPDTSIATSEYAGANDNPGLWDLGGTALIAKIELGSGPIPRTLFCDVRSGRWALGSQTRVRISVARWIGDNIATSTELSLQGAVAPCGGGSDADPLTYTCGKVLAIGAVQSLVTPPGAGWFDCLVSPAGAQVQINGVGGMFYKDTTLAAPVCYPPATPWPLSNLGVLDFENVGIVEATLVVTFWLR
jgi:hypothetical protein